MKSRCCLCVPVYPPYRFLGNGSVKKPLIVARQRLGKIPLSLPGNGLVKIPLSLLGNRSVKIPLSLLGNGSVETLPR
jgi:hypothetical protein